MRTNCSLLRVSTLAFLLGTTGLHAAVTAIFDNLDTSTGSGSGSGAITPSIWIAQSFVVGANDYTFTSLVLSVGDADDPSGNFVIQLHRANDLTGGPGEIVALLNGPNPELAGLYEYAYTADEPLTLDHDTTYYVSFGVTEDGGTYRWDYEIDATVEEGSDVGFHISSDAGTSWSSPPSTFAVLAMQVNGEIVPVPEPVNVALGIFGALLVGVWTFRGRNARAPIKDLV